MEAFAAAIVGALTTAVVNLVEPAVQDAYTGLKTLIVERFRDKDPLTAAAVENLDQESEEKLAATGQFLEGRIKDVDLTGDAEVASALSQLETRLEEARQAGRLRVVQRLEGGEDDRVIGAQLDSAADLDDRGLDIEQEGKGTKGSTFIGLQMGKNKKTDDE